VGQQINIISKSYNLQIKEICGIIVGIGLLYFSRGTTGPRIKGAEMKKLLLAAAAALTILPPSAAQAVDHTNRVPFEIHAHPSYNCVSFQLEGVSVADPSIGGAWFSLRKDHPHFAELFAILLTARAGKLPVRVQTSGSACLNSSVEVISVL
jgi:hypothetical protein